MSSKNACVEGQEALNTYDIFLRLPGLTEIGLQQPIPFLFLSCNILPFNIHCNFYVYHINTDNAIKYTINKHQVKV